MFETDNSGIITCAVVCTYIHTAYKLMYLHSLI